MVKTSAKSMAMAHKTKALSTATALIANATRNAMTSNNENGSLMKNGAIAFWYTANVIQSVAMMTTAPMPIHDHFSTVFDF